MNNLQKENKKLLKRQELLIKQQELDRKQTQIEMRRTFYATIGGAMTIVAGLFWQDAIKDTLDLFPKLSGIVGNYITAVVITAIFVLIIVKLNNTVKRKNKRIEKERKKLENELLKT